MKPQLKTFIALTLTHVALLIAFGIMLLTQGCVTVNPQYKGDTATRTLDAACTDAGVLMVCLYRGFEKPTSNEECYECIKKDRDPAVNAPKPPRDPNQVPDGSHR